MSISLLIEDKYFAKYCNYVISICLLTKINTLLNIILMLMSICLLMNDKYFVKYYNEVMSICLLTKINSLLNNIMMLCQSLY